MSSTQHSEFSTMTAAADYSAKQHYIVKQTGDEEVTLAGDGEQVFGILANKPKLGEMAQVTRANSGVQTKVIAGGAITRGNRIAADADGKAVVAASGDEAFGIATTDAVSGDIFPCYFEHKTIA